MSEEWRTIMGSDGLYSVSNLGRVMNNRTGRVLVPKTLPSGYQRVKVRTDDNKRDKYVHRLVADAFCDHPHGCDVVNHIDNDKLNNRADNLEWTTQRGNVIHAMKQGRVKNFPLAQMVAAIKDGEMRVFRSIHEAEVETGCDHKLIGNACRIGGSAKGYKWRYVA